MAPKGFLVLSCIGLLISPCPANSLGEEEDVDDPDPDPYLQLIGEFWGYVVTAIFIKLIP